MKVCTVDGCDRVVHARGLCNMHYQRSMDHGSTRDRGRRVWQPPAFINIGQVCRVVGCDAAAFTRGLCSRHYARWQKRHDVPLVESTEDKPGARLTWLQQVALTYEGDECLRWPFPYSVHGYARVTINGRRQWAHRWICVSEHGEPPDPGDVARHLCGNGQHGCLAKRHLQWGTHQENAADKFEHGTQPLGTDVHGSRLTAPDVLQIRRLLRAGKGLTEVARQFDVSYGCIQAISLKKSWKWLPDEP